jgi:hypothetical protein
MKTRVAATVEAVVLMQPNLPLQWSGDKDRPPYLSGSNFQPGSALSEKGYEKYLVSSINLQENNSSKNSSSSGSNTAKHTSP